MHSDLWNLISTKYCGYCEKQVECNKKLVSERNLFLQRVVRTARHIVGGELPSLQDIYTRRRIRKAWRIIKDSSHPSHSLLSLLPSGRRLRSIQSHTSRLRDSFFPSGYQANEQQKPIHPTAHSHFTIYHALHFNLNSNTVQLDYTHTHTHTRCTITTTYLLPLDTIQDTHLHIHDIAYLAYV